MYSYEPKGKNFGRAYVQGVNASFKDLCAVCDSVRGRNAQSAIEFLAAAAKGEKAIAYRTHNAGMGHRKELGGRKGGYPKKAAGIILKLVESAYANASIKGFTNLKVKHISANKQNCLPRMSPKGKRMRMDYETANAQVVLEEISTPAWSKPRAKKKAVKAQPKMPVAKKEKPAEAKPAETKTAVDAKTTPITTPAKTETVNAQKSATPAQTTPAKTETVNAQKSATPAASKPQ
ncbi:50S ribosomal protein L22 [Candidatus Anstonella stagnisolia]|nr:50S ribosomal protein L22 [Candidatus Anstonella stagnisolia]